MAKKSGFASLPRLVKIILLLIPFVNWIVELVLRWGDLIDRGVSLGRLLITLIVTLTGWAYWVEVIDIIVLLFTNHFWLLKK